MARTVMDMKAGGASCGCLPDVMPEGVQQSLEDVGGVAALPSLMPSEGHLEERARVHKALADPLRLKVMSLLAVSPFCVCVIRAVTLVEDSRLSYHLGILKGAGLIESRKDGSWMIYSLTSEGRRWLGGP